MKLSKAGFESVIDLTEDSDEEKRNGGRSNYQTLQSGTQPDDLGQTRTASCLPQPIDSEASVSKTAGSESAKTLAMVNYISQASVKSPGPKSIDWSANQSLKNIADTKRTESQRVLNAGPNLPGPEVMVSLASILSSNAGAEGSNELLLPLSSKSGLPASAVTLHPETSAREAQLRPPRNRRRSDVGLLRDFVAENTTHPQNTLRHGPDMFRRKSEAYAGFLRVMRVYDFLDHVENIHGKLHKRVRAHAGQNAQILEQTDRLTDLKSEITERDREVSFEKYYRLFETINEQVENYVRISKVQRELKRGKQAQGYV